MRLVPWTTLSAAIIGDDLVTAVVSRGVTGAAVRQGPVLHRFLAMPPDEARRAFAAIDPGRAVRVLLTVPTSWCAVRPVPLDAKGWPRAREGVLASIEQLVPVASNDAMAGIISRRAQPQPAGSRTESGDDPAGASGWLIVARRSAVAPWADAITRALGRPPTAVLAAPMAATGLGLQNADRAEVLDELAGAVSVRHTLIGGEIEDIASPLGMVDSPAPGAVRLPAVGIEPGGVELTPHDLAVAAALAEEVGAGRFVPLDGPAKSAPNRWALPVAAAIGAALLFIGAGKVSNWRYQRAIDAIAESRVALEPRQREIERTRAEAVRYAALIENGVNPILKSWTPALEPIADAQSAVSGDGFLYWIRADGAGVEMRGEAKQAADVLRALEAPTSRFTRARLIDPVSPVPQRGLETFTVRAERKPDPAPAAIEASPKGGAS